MCLCSSILFCMHQKIRKNLALGAVNEAWVTSGICSLAGIFDGAPKEIIHVCINRVK